MARIMATQVAADEYELTIVDLSTTWKGSDRTCYWYWNYSENRQYYPIPGTQYERYDETTIVGAPSSGGTLYIWDMGYNQTYWFTVSIWGTPPTHSKPQELTTLAVKVQTDSNGYPWSIRCNGYDYNGELFLFGKVDSENVKCSHVDVTVKEKSTGNKYTYRAYLDTVNYTGVFNMRTSEFGYSSAPPTLSPGAYTVHVKLFRANGEVIGENDLFTLSGNETTTTLWEYIMHNSLSPPSLSYNPDTKTITVSNQGYGRYFLEIRRQNRNKVNTEYTEEEKDYFYTTLLRRTESGKYDEGIPWISQCYDNNGNRVELVPMVYQHTSKNLKTKILFDEQAGFTESEKTKYYNLICNALDYVASAAGISFNDRTKATRVANSDLIECQNNDFNKYSDYNMIIRIGLSDMMYPNGGYLGTWDAYVDNNYGIAVSFANIAANAAEEEGRLKATIFEEILQSLGMGNDSYSHEESVHWDPWYHDTEKLSSIDSAILKLYYQRDIRGWSAFDLLNEYDTPCLLFQDYTGEDLVFDVSDLVEDEDFYAWAWTAEYVSGKYDAGYDNDLYSPRSQISFNSTGSSSRPAQFQWTFPKRKGETFKLTAEEWNSFTKHVDELLAYKGLNYPLDYKVSPGRTVSSGMYTEIKDRLARLNYGSAIPNVYSGYPITADITSSNPADNNINIIVTEVNNIPANDE